LTLFAIGCGGVARGPSLTVAINAGVEGNALQSAALEWGAQRSVHVETVVLPYASLFEKELLDLISPATAYDVIMIDDPWFPRLAEGQKLTALDELARTRGLTWPDPDFIESCLDVCRFPYLQGPYYALPYVGNSQLFFYRKDLFDKHELPAPETWEDVLAAAKVIGASEKMYGYVMRAAAGNAAVTDFMPLLWAFGGAMFAEDERSTVASDATLEALRFMLELGKYTPPGYAGFNADEVAAHMLQSTAVMSINWPAWIAAMDDPGKSKVVGRIEFKDMPSAKKQGAPSLGTWLLAIPTRSQNTQLALDFILWATEPGRMKEAALRGNPPTRRSVFLDPELRKQFRSFPAQLASLESARPRPRTLYWNEIEHVFGAYLSQANAGGIRPEEALKRADEEISAIMRRSQ
jgi:multiple sugar transport system substrate-binding protein